MAPRHAFKDKLIINAKYLLVTIYKSCSKSNAHTHTLTLNQSDRHSKLQLTNSRLKPKSKIYRKLLKI